MQQNKGQLGDLLKEKRIEKNLSLKDAENATSIRSNYLQAIEDNQLHDLISPVYMQGFMRQYASFLGFEVEELQRDYPDAFVALQGAQEFSYGIGTLEMRGHPGGGVKWLPNLGIMLLLGLLLAVAWAFARYLEVI